MSALPMIGGGGGKAFKEVAIGCAPTSSQNISARIYNIENAVDGDQLTGITEYGTYLQIVSTSSNNYVVARSNITAMVVKGYDLADYTLRNYTSGQTIATIDRVSGHLMLVGVL